MAISRLDRNELVPFSDKQYAKTQWMDGNRPAINAENLLKIESGLYELYRYLCTGADGSGIHYQNLIKISNSINEIVDALNMEVSLRDSQTSALSGRIDGEATRAKTAEDDIQREIGSEDDSAGHTVNINNTIVPTVHGRITKICDELEALIEEEKKRALGAEATLSTSIEKETNNRIKADEDLVNEVTTQYKNYTDKAKKEITDSIGVQASSDTNTVYGKMNSYKNELSDDIQNEVSRATAEESFISQQIIDETARATKSESDIISIVNNKETSLNTKITQETNRATERENSLEESFDSALIEISERVDRNSELIAMSDATAVANEVISLRLKSQDLETKIDELTLNDLNDGDTIPILDGGNALQFV